jgi:hypothetical protein
MDTNRWTLSDYLQIGFGGFPYGGLMSIDVTYKCNLHCLHCCFSRQDNAFEISSEEWVARLEKMKSRGKPLFICGWLGGEPLLRPEVIEVGKRYFKSNIIFTNGTIELPSWPDCTFVVSVPGTKVHYQDLTGADGKVYDLVKDHANPPDLNVVVSFCITRRNVSSISGFLSEWQTIQRYEGCSSSSTLHEWAKARNSGLIGLSGIMS